MEIEKLSEKALLAKIEQMEEKMSKVRQRMIAAGRGHETHSDMIEKNDELSRDYQYVHNIQFALFSERRRRRDYHGSLKPIPLWSFK